MYVKGWRCRRWDRLPVHVQRWFGLTNTHSVQLRTCPHTSTYFDQIPTGNGRGRFSAADATCSRNGCRSRTGTGIITICTWRRARSIRVRANLHHGCDREKRFHFPIILLSRQLDSVGNWKRLRHSSQMGVLIGMLHQRIMMSRLSNTVVTVVQR